jgi:hypothetical protein
MIKQILLAALSAAFAHAYEVNTITPEQAAEYNLDPEFFSKGTVTQDILIATSKRVADTTHRETAYLFDRIIKTLKPEIAQRIREDKVLCILVAHDELTSDIPPFKTDKTGEELAFYNWRQRGFLTKINERRVVFFAEEDVMEYEGGMRIESILIHEFGHVIQFAGFDDEFEKRLDAAYAAAKEKGLWNDGRAAQRFRRVKGDEPVSLLDALVKSFPKQSPALLRACLNGGDILVNGQVTTADVKVTGKDEVLIMFGGKKECYAIKNKAEYLAEGVQAWFDTNRTMDHDHNHIHTREQLKTYDPGLAQLCSEILGDTEWRFVSPRLRAGEGHLADYDPKTAPVVVKSEFIENAALDYYDDYWETYWQRLHEKYPQIAN